MGNIRTKTVKRASRQVVEKYFHKMTQDFFVNKRVILDVTKASSKKLKNKIAGYATHLMKRIAKGPVRGVSLKLQEEERERRMDYVPEVSWVDQRVQDGIAVDPVTMKMLKKMETGVPRFVRPEKEELVTVTRRPGGPGGRGRGEGRGRGDARGRK